MKWISLILCLCFFGSLPIIGAEKVKEGFEGQVFPPRCWNTFTEETSYGSGGWSSRLNETGHCAYGIALCTFYGHYFDAVLCTSHQPLLIGDNLTISFDLKLEAINGGSMVVMLCTKTDSFWSSFVTLPPVGESQRFSYSLPSITSSESYQIRWYLDASCIPNPAAIAVYLDNVTVERNAYTNQTQTEPSSLGRIKSAYK